MKKVLAGNLKVGNLFRPIGSKMIYRVTEVGQSFIKGVGYFGSGTIDTHKKSEVYLAEEDEARNWMSFRR